MLDPRDRRKHAFRAAAGRRAARPDPARPDPARPAERDALPRLPADDDATGTAASPLAPSPIAPAETPRVPRATLTVHRPDVSDALPDLPADDAVARRAANRRFAEAAGWTPGPTPPDGARAPLRLVDTRRTPER